LPIVISSTVHFAFTPAAGNDAMSSNNLETFLRHHQSTAAHLLRMARERDPLGAMVSHT
jgi:hypothetical protein